MKNITLILLVSLLIISCEKDNGGSSSNSPNSKDTTTSLINPPQKYWGDYYSKSSGGNYHLVASISKDDVIYEKESLSLKYKNHGLKESIGNQYILTTTFSASPMLGDFHKYTITTLNDSMIKFEAKQNGISEQDLIKK